MKKSLLDKLKAYSLTAGAVAAGANADAQVLYTNVNPDSLTTGTGSSYDLDLDNDGNVDFVIDIFQSSFSGSFTFTGGFFNYAVNSQGIRIDALGSNEVLGNWAQALGSGIAVQNQQYGWTGGYYGNNVLANHVEFFSSFSFSTYYGSTISGTYSGTFQNGNFPNAQDKYLGLRVMIGGAMHYGWARLDVLSGDSFVVKDYAIELEDSTFIVTGDTGLMQHALPAISVNALDVNNNGDGSDITVEFDEAADESSVGLYRIIVVKESSSAGFSLVDAQNVASNSYFPVAPSGAGTYSETLYAGMKDSDGDVITTEIPYKVFIHTIANPAVALEDALSQPSDTVELEEFVALEPVQFVSIFDVDDNGNGEDLEVNFNRLANENNLEEYRIFIVKSESAPFFTLSIAEANSNYYTQVPNGQNVSVVLNDDSRDADGDLIENDVPYRAFVMSVADGVNAIDNFLSPASNEVTLDQSTGIDNVTKSDNIRVAYNTGSVSISTRNGAALQHVELFTMDGKLLKNEMLNQAEITLDNTQLSSGVYLVRVTEQGVVHTLKVAI